MERVGIAGSIRRLWMPGSSAKIRNKKNRQGSPVASLMPKLVFSVEENINYSRNEVSCVGLRLGLARLLFQTPSVAPQPLAKVSVGKGCTTSWIRCDSHVATQGGLD